MPLTLLEFAIAANKTLLEHCISGGNGTNEVLLSEVIRICELMPRNIHTFTAGLIEIVDDKTPQRELKEPIIHPSDVALLSFQTTTSAGVSNALYPSLHVLHKIQEAMFPG